MKLIKQEYYNDEYESSTSTMLCEDIQELEKYIIEHINNIQSLDVEFFAETKHIIEYFDSIPLVSIKIYKQVNK